MRTRLRNWVGAGSLVGVAWIAFVGLALSEDAESAERSRRVRLSASVRGQVQWSVNAELRADGSCVLVSEEKGWSLGSKVSKDTLCAAIRRLARRSAEEAPPVTQSGPVAFEMRIDGRVFPVRFKGGESCPEGASIFECVASRKTGASQDLVILLQGVAEKMTEKAPSEK